ncbi:MAG: GNAT family N-acetyltransferase [Anaerolineae bacterium]|nr:GNAT family N-acetyltransferase [Anaerolineae bacterium]
MLNAEDRGNRFRLPLSGTLVLKSAATEEDIRRVDDFNTDIHGEVIRHMTYNIFAHHPCTDPDGLLYVEDEAAGQIVSSLCQIPWQWYYEDVVLKAGEMGIVGTLPEYRHRGLIRALDKQFKALLKEDGCHLSHIQGIPYYYRQFGYEYAVPLEGGWLAEIYQLPEDETEGYTFRQAAEDDIATLMSFYNEASKQLDISALRDADIWHYLLEFSIESETAREFWLVLDQQKEPVGYFGIALQGFGTGLIVSETSRLDYQAGPAVLPQLRKMAVERKKDNIRFKLHEDNDLVKIAQAHGARNSGTYAWQIHLPDPAGLISHIAPVLERRIAVSPFAGMTDVVTINTYREAYNLDFKDGKLTEVRTIHVDWADINIPPNLLPVLMLGYRTFEKLKETYLDLDAQGKGRPLIDILFPPLKSYIHTMY